MLAGRAIRAAHVLNPGGPAPADRFASLVAAGRVAQACGNPVVRWSGQSGTGQGPCLGWLRRVGGSVSSLRPISSKQHQGAERRAGGGCNQREVASPRSRRPAAECRQKGNWARQGGVSAAVGPPRVGWKGRGARAARWFGPAPWSLQSAPPPMRARSQEPNEGAGGGEAQVGIGLGCGIHPPPRRATRPPPFGKGNEAIDLEGFPSPWDRKHFGQGAHTRLGGAFHKGEHPPPRVGFGSPDDR